MLNFAKIALKLLVIFTGLNGFAAEILLLRELLIIFSGNEFTIGIIFANWLLLESIGSYFIGKRADRSRNIIRDFFLLTFIFCLSFPLVVYLTRILKPLLGFSIGESLSLVYIFFSSFFILLPVSITHGALFTYSCKLYSVFENNQTNTSSISNIYIFETIGTLLGSFILTYFLIPYFNTFRIVGLLTTFNILFCILFLITYEKISYKKRYLFVCFIASFTFLFLLIFYTDKLHWSSIKTLWKNQSVLDYQNSKYNNICVTTYERQYTFFINGKPSIITPVPDIMFVEEYVNLPLLTHHCPKDILVISGGVGGVINEILKHLAVKTVDYVELDPLIIKLLEKFPTELTERELRNERVNLYFLDGRYFIKLTTKTYDVIFLGVGDPQDLQTNRFFTKEFFTLVNKRLNPEGILVTTISGSLTYLGKELINLNSCIYNTLKEVFRYVYVLPGDGKNIYISSNKEVELKKEKIISEILKRKLNYTTLLPRHIEYKLHPQWQSWFFRYINQTEKDINSDLKPKAVFYSLSYWNSLFAPYVNKFFKIIEGIDVAKVIVIMIMLWCVFIIVKLKKLNKVVSPVCVFTTGFMAMVANLVVMTSFQVTYGYIFYWIGILTGFFMLGTTLGATFSDWITRRFNNLKRLLLFTELFIIVFCISLLIFLKFLLPYFEQIQVFKSLKFIFLILNTINGFIVGYEFPIANSLQLKVEGSLGKTAGLIYSSDLLGGWLAGIFSSVVFLPLLGVIESSLVIMVLKLLSFMVVLILNGFF